MMIIKKKKNYNRNDNNNNNNNNNFTADFNLHKIISLFLNIRSTCVGFGCTVYGLFVCKCYIKGITVSPNNVGSQSF